jgi:hypothetical protein
MKFADGVLTKMHDLIDRIGNSGLKISQIINAIRMYIIPKAEYLMRNSVVARTRLRNLDNFIRSVINKRIGGPALPKELFCTSWKNGGLSITNLEERYNVCKIGNLAHLLGGGLGETYRGYMEMVRNKRRIGFRNASISTKFFNWDVDKDYKFPKKIKSGYHNEIMEAFRAVKKCSWIVDFNEKQDNIYVKWLTRDDNGHEKMIDLFGTDNEYDKYPAPSEVSKALMKNLREQHHKELLKLPSCFQMTTFKNSTVSNFMLGNCKAPVTDFVLKFIIRARVNTLWTPAVRAARVHSYHGPVNCNCSNGRKCNLLHILNNCNLNLARMTLRHNMVSGKLVEGIELRKDLSGAIFENKKLVVDEMLKEGKEFDSRIRPDIWFWTEDENVKKLWIIEIKCPFGRNVIEESGAETDSIKQLENSVWRKYEPLIKNVKKAMVDRDAEGRRIKINFKLVVVSSLGAITSKTLFNIGEIVDVDNNQTRSLWGKRCAIAAIKGSAAIWYKSLSRIHQLTADGREIRDLINDTEDEGIFAESKKEEVEIINNHLHTLVFEELDVLELNENEERADDVTCENITNERIVEKVEGKPDELIYDDISPRTGMETSEIDQESSDSEAMESEVDSPEDGVE